MGGVALEWVVALGVGAVLAELARSMLQRRKMGADAAKVITDAATVLLAPLQARIKELEHIVDELRIELINAKEEVHQARLVITALERRLGLDGDPLP